MTKTTPVLGATVQEIAKHATAQENVLIVMVGENKVISNRK